MKRISLLLLTAALLAALLTGCAGTGYVGPITPDEAGDAAPDPDGGGFFFDGVGETGPHTGRPVPRPRGLEQER